MPEFNLALSITVKTGLSVGGSGSTGVGADKTIQRDGLNRPIIPASQLKGRLRHSCETILRAANIAVCYPPNPETTCPQPWHDPAKFCPICDIFGSPWQPSPLQFSDLVHQDRGSDIRPDIGLDRWRRIVKEKLLFLTETTRPGSQPVFYNAAVVQGELAEEGQALLLLAGLDLIHSWGGSKSRGLGWALTAAEARFEGKALLLKDRKEALAQWLQQRINW